MQEEDYGSWKERADTGGRIQGGRIQEEKDTIVIKEL